MTRNGWLQHLTTDESGCNISRLKDLLLELSRYAGVIVVAYILSVIGLGKAMLDWSLWAEDIFFYLSFLLIILEIPLFWVECGALACAKAHVTAGTALV